MLQALVCRHSISCIELHALTTGYWAYGNGVAANLTDSLSGPPWAKALAYMAAFFQILVSLHVSH